MQAPPTYVPPPQKNKTAVIIWIVVGVVFGCCVLPIVLIGGGGFWLFNKAKGIVGCTMGFQGAQEAIVDYAKAHNGKLPNAETWQDDVREGYRRRMLPQAQTGPIEQMPADGMWGCKDSDGNLTGMAYNSDLSGKKMDDIKDQVSTIVLFETEHPAKNLHEKYKARDFANSPKMLGKNRGWMEVGLVGAPVLVGRTGQRVPINTGPGAGGANGGNPFVDIQSKPGDDGK